MSGEGSKRGKKWKFGVFDVEGLISRMTPETKRLMAEKLGKIIEEELEAP